MQNYDHKLLFSYSGTGSTCTIRVLKIRTHKIIAINCPENETVWFYSAVMGPKDKDGMGNSESPDQTAPSDLGLRLWQPVKIPIRAQGYIKKFMLNSAEHEILDVPKYKNIKKFSFFQGQISQQCYFSC